MRIALMTLFLAACGPSVDTNANTCETCLQSGGTWQPEVSSCTVDCAIQDISCFEQECPGECDAANCGNCFSQSDCEAATCTWTTENEASTCL